MSVTDAKRTQVMRVFITGGTGLIGSAVIAELLGHGHTVLALARSDASAQAAQTAGAEPLLGEEQQSAGASHHGHEQGERSQRTEWSARGP